ncbi:CLUMA_CG016568, isoform A [Clunio marinus]|uniref:CLUMA_CG016568, isoform A n=1 Tax=Clunio marinus TaxID=568069 RepID=A0A1J1ITH6_9DIPT|nr:CLUMA_CG016568, isoform A [Clunio marinus]
MRITLVMVAEPEPLHVRGRDKMIILLYLIVILGWALLILIIKCRKAREKRIAMAEPQNQNAIHVIQIGNTFYDVIPINNPSASVARCPRRCHHHSHCRRSVRVQRSESNSSINNINAHTNPSFVLDEGVYPGAPPSGLEAPPSYDEVIRLPNQYPKITSSSTVVTPINEHPPPTIAEIEGNDNSITTITSLSPAVFSNQQQRTPANETRTCVT